MIGLRIIADNVVVTPTIGYVFTYLLQVRACKPIRLNFQTLYCERTTVHEYPLLTSEPE